jgi:hypothetical protein
LFLFVLCVLSTSISIIFFRETFWYEQNAQNPRRQRKNKMMKSVNRSTPSNVVVDEACLPTRTWDSRPPTAAYLPIPRTT